MSIEIHADVSRMLESVCEPDSENHFTASDVRDHAMEFLCNYDSEIQRFPQLAGQTHFEFVMADYDLTRDAVFIVYLFRPDVLELFAGRGDSFPLRSVVEQELPEDTDKAADSLRRRARFSAAPLQLQSAELSSGWAGTGDSPFTTLSRVRSRKRGRKSRVGSRPDPFSNLRHSSETRVRIG